MNHIKETSEKLTKEALLCEIEKVRSEMQSDDRLHMRAQKDIFEFLEEALEHLGEEESESSLNKAAFKVTLAHCRRRQAHNQKNWLALSIFFWGIIAFLLSAWTIYEWRLWPLTKEMAVQYILLGSVVWGLLGSSLDMLRELHTRFARQELDPYRIYWYFAHPLIGAGLGGIIFLLIFAGLLAVGQTEILPLAEGTGGFNPSLPFVLSALAGFEQKNIIQYLRDTIIKVLNISEREPHEAG